MKDFIKNVAQILWIFLIFTRIAFSQIDIKAVQYRDCYACNQDGSKNLILCNVCIEFTNTNKLEGYYIILKDIRFLSGDNCYVFEGSATEKVRLRKNDGQAPGSTYRHQLTFDPWKNFCCNKCDDSVKTTTLTMPVYDMTLNIKKFDLTFQIKTCCGREPFCSITTGVNILKNYEMDIVIQPNPITSNNFFISLDSPVTDEVNLKIIDMLGNTLFEYKSFINEGKNKIQILESIINLSSGNYLLLVKIGKNNCYYDYKKIIISK